jgi:hypothetical protein
MDDDFELEDSLENKLFTRLYGSPGHKIELADRLVKIFQRIPQKELDILLNKRNVIFILPINTTAEPLHVIESADLVTIWLVSLDPEVLTRPESQFIYTVVHELAHAFYEHPFGRRADYVSERELEADLKVIEWGFEAELRESPYNYLYGTGWHFKQDRRRGP